MTYILIAIGGAFGSVVRYVLGKTISKSAKSVFPFGTFIINITGAILLGLVSSRGVSSSIYHLLADGFLGAYTTFSTFMYEGFDLFRGKSWLNAFIYVIGSVILGILGYIVGFEAGRY